MTRFFFFIFLIVVVNQLSAQVDKKVNHQIEFQVIPTIIYNYALTGYTLQLNKKHEHAIYLSTCLIPITGYRANLSITYNYNYFPKNNIFYFTPVWLRVSNTLNDVGSEDGYSPHTLRYTLGSGIGVRLPIKKRFYFKSEIGMGTSLNFTSGSSKINSFTFYDPDNYKVDDLYPDQMPRFLPAFRLNLKFGIILGRI